jgi:ubiquitin carboxyl-terminal hydrolase L3
MVPKPVKAVVFLFPITDKLETSRHQEDKVIKAGQSHLDPSVVFIKQTASYTANL